MTGKRSHTPLAKNICQPDPPKVNLLVDIQAKLQAGKLVLIEFKGDDQDNSDSKMKLELGRQWQAQAGQNYHYFMVVKNKDFGIDGAYTLEQFMEIMREL